jgi:hypothetical protein
MVSCLQFLHFQVKLHKNAHALYLLFYYCDLPNLFNPPQVLYWVVGIILENV